MPIATAHVPGGQVQRVTPPSALDGSLLLRLDLRAPPVTRLPPTADELEAALGQSSGVVRSYVRLDNPLGGLHDDLGPAQSHLATVAGTGLLERQRAVGWWTGTSMIGQRCTELLAAGTAALQADTTAGYRLATGGSVLVVFRFGRYETAAPRAIAGRCGGTGPGWYLRRNVGALELVWIRADTTRATLTVTIPNNGQSRAWHWALIKVDAATDTITLNTDMGAAAGSIAAETTEEPAGVAFRVGAGLEGLGAASVQVLAVAHLSAAAPDSGVAAWWRYGKDPNSVITTTTRNGSIGTLVARDVAAGDYFAGWDANQLPFSYRPDLLTDSKLGLRTTRAWTNLVTDTRVDTWSAVGGVTVTPDAADSPWGLRETPRLTKTTSSGMLVKGAGSATGGNVYRFGAHLWADAPIACTIHFQIGGVTVRSKQVTLTTARVRYEDTFTAGATNTAAIAIEPGAAGTDVGAAVYASDPFVVESPVDQARDLMALTIGGSGLISASAYAWTGSNHQKGDVGTMRVRCAADVGELPVSGDPSALMSTGAPAHRREIRADSTEAVAGQVWDTAGAAQTAGATAADQPIEFPMLAELEWSATTPIATGIHSRLRVNGGAWVTGATAPWTANDTQPTFDIGHRNGGNQFPGIVDLVEIYSARA